MRKTGFPAAFYIRLTADISVFRKGKKVFFAAGLAGVRVKSGARAKGKGLLHFGITEKERRNHEKVVSSL